MISYQLIPSEDACDLGIEVVMEAVVEVGLHGKGLVEELLEEVLLRSLAHQDAAGVVVLPGPIRGAHHLKTTQVMVIRSEGDSR